ncbi:esterase-like activity of phytase family protein [Aquimarina addita]|uniref:Esterase-like activity of phytase family protein n=1 Tax=Aquimarina addita TaxID=870485 RepID=A0ABP6US70_9FLAO
MSLKKIDVFILFFMLSSFIVSCQNIEKTSTKKTYEIKYLDEYVIQDDSIFKSSTIGGLSGIEYRAAENKYYIACDDPKSPRFYKASILIENNSFLKITFDTVVKLKDSKHHFFTSSAVDIESIRAFDKDTLIFSSEGSIKNNQDPSVFLTDSEGNYIDQLILPSNFLADASGQKNQPRHNKALEGLAKDIQGQGYWVAMEGTLEQDGAMPTFTNTGAPIRITHFDMASKKADYQFTYPLDKIAKDPKDQFGVNGVTGIIQLSQHQFLCIERGYAAGYGSQGNTVRIYLANTEKATNTLNFLSLNDKRPVSATKKLLFDLESVRDQLTDRIVDNIEDITFGPTLSNGNQSLILVSDNNFNPPSIQINQFILLELIETLILE